MTKIFVDLIAQRIVTTTMRSRIVVQNISESDIAAADTASKQYPIACVDCNADLSARVDWEPFLQNINTQRIAENWANFFDEESPKTETLHLAICAECIEKRENT